MIKGTYCKQKHARRMGFEEVRASRRAPESLRLTCMAKNEGKIE